MNKNAAKSNAALLLAAAIWGLAFVFQSDSMNYIGPFTFMASRYFLGSFALIPVCAVTLRSVRKQNGREGAKKVFIRSIKVGAVCGVVLFAASAAQQIGIIYTPAGKAGFITALYIVLVPVFSRLIFKTATAFNTWVSVVAAAIGLYLLCVKEGFSVSGSDLWVILCAFIFTAQILMVDRLSHDTDSAVMAMSEFFVVAVISVPFACFTETVPQAQQIKGALISIAYTGVMSSSIAYTLQIVGQKKSENPTVAALLMSMEAVFAAVSGWLILHESFSGREFAGVILMAAAIVFSQIPPSFFKAWKARI